MRVHKRLLLIEMKTNVQSMTKACQTQIQMIKMTKVSQTKLSLTIFFFDNEQDLESDNEIDNFSSELPKIFEEDEKFGDDTNENSNFWVMELFLLL